MEQTFKFNHTPLTYSLEARVVPSQVDKVYFGQLDCCACGCGGEYFTDQEHIVRALGWLEAGKKIESVDNYIFDCTMERKGSKSFGIRVYLKK